jgi:iron(III) transport system substrate-binding protein
MCGAPVRLDAMAENLRTIATANGAEGNVMRSIVMPKALFIVRMTLVLSALTTVSATVHAATVAEIANLKTPDREQVLVEGAKKESKVVLYSAMIEDQALRPITQAFRQKYPFIEPQFWRADTRDLINKALAEARARAVVGDIIEGGGVSQALIKAGTLQSFSTPALAPFAKERFDGKGFWAATRVSYFGLAYNTRAVKADEAPKTYQDLLDAKWKGKLCWASTTETGGALMFITFIRRAFGEERGEAYLRDLSKQAVANLSGSPREVVNKVMQGECTIALDIFLHHPIISAQKGAPVAARALEPVLSNASVVTLAKGSTHPHAAMLLIDYLLSLEAQQVLEKADYLPAHPDAAPQKSLESIVPRMANLEELFLSEEYMFDNRAKSLELQQKYFGSR